MQLMIEINEEDYNIMKHNIAENNPLCPLSQEEMVSKVANGIPLPKGHGKIVDVGTIDLNQDEFISQSDYYAAECAVENAITIVEAENEIKDYKNEPEVKQESCKDEYIKVPKKALKYRTTETLTYNVEWLKKHIDTERAIICGEQI